MDRTITYFEETGAGDTGATAVTAPQILGKACLKLVIVPHQRGFRDEERFDMEVAAQVEREGHRMHWSTMLFHTEGLYGNATGTALANILRTFGQGMKVCLEILLMAADGGAVDRGEKIIVVAGTGRGADTAILATASTSNRVREVRVHEILCKPLLQKIG